MSAITQKILPPASDGSATPVIEPLEGVSPGGRVVVAMSGGVDSSVTAAVLKDLGYETIGITLQLYDHGEATPQSRTCCAGQDIQDARRVAESLGIDHYVLDYESRFRDQVMEDFADSYLAGETPIPCVRCNQTVKFHDLLATARDLGAEALATGHYVRRRLITGQPGQVGLYRGADPEKDQSYFLFATTRAQLDFLRFPLGHLSKARTRALAVHHGLGVADKPDSQDICFVPGGRYADVIEKLRPGAAEPGDIVNLKGETLGRHPGIIHYTIGQRRGLGLGGGDPLYVVRLDPAAHRVVVGPRQALQTAACDLRQLNWISGPPDGADDMAVCVKVRSTTAPVAARIRATGAAKATVVFEEPELGVAPGQACVLYDGERMLGGGWIAATRAEASAP